MADSVPEETSSEMATTLISNKIKMEISRAIPASRGSLRIEFRALTEPGQASLIGIDAPSAAAQLYQARLARGGVWKRSGNDQRHDDIPNVPRRIVGSRRGASRRCRLRGGLNVTSVADDRHRIPSGKHTWIGGYHLCCGRIVDNILNEGRKLSIVGGVGIRVHVPRLRCSASHERRPLQLIPHPRHHGVLRIDLRLDDQIEVARRDAAAPYATGGPSGIGVVRVARAPGKRGVGKVGMDAIVEAGRWIAGIIDVAHDLVQPKPRFLERIQYLRIGLIPLLGSAEQRERRATDEKKNPEGGQQFDESKAALFRFGANPAHLFPCLNGIECYRLEIAVAARLPDTQNETLGVHGSAVPAYDHGPAHIIGCSSWVRRVPEREVKTRTEGCSEINLRKVIDDDHRTPLVGVGGCGVAKLADMCGCGRIRENSRIERLIQHLVQLALRKNQGGGVVAIAVVQKDRGRYELGDSH